MSDDFKKDIELFMKNSQNINDAHIKLQYYKLVKKYHPDMNIDNREYCNECMMTLNYLYSTVKNKKKIIKTTGSCENNYKKSKYQFINRFKKVETISNKSLFFYKLGLDRILWVRDYICTHSIYLGYGDEIIKKASQELYQAIQYLNNSIKLDTNNWWYNEAIEKIKWAYEINNRITKNFILKISDRIKFNDGC